MANAPMYESFAAVILVVLGLLIVLARASQAMFSGLDEAEQGEDGNEWSDDGDGRSEAGSRIPATGAARIERHFETGQSRAERIEREVLDAGTSDEDGTPESDAERTPWSDDAEADDHTPWGENEAETDARLVRQDDELEFTTGALLANVAVSQGLFGAAIVGAAWLAEIPLAAFGVDPGDPASVGLPAVGVGLAVGVVLYVANELSAEVADAAGIDYSEGLREALAPDALRGWVVLLGAILPVIAGFEELLFRAALIGAFSTGFGVSPWLLAVLSTLAFAVGHGAQGPGGVAVTGLLGFALAAAFVLTGSLLVVIVAHYVVNALEFVVHEGLGIEWT